MSTRPTHKTNFTQEEKAAAVAELQAGGSAKEIADRLGITTSGLYYWRRHLPAPVKGKAVVVSSPIVETQHAMRDATLLLRRAKSELMRGIKAGTINDLDQAHLLSLLALQSLQGN